MLQHLSEPCPAFGLAVSQQLSLAAGRCRIDHAAIPGTFVRASPYMAFNYIDVRGAHRERLRETLLDFIPPPPPPPPPYNHGEGL